MKKILLIIAVIGIFAVGAAGWLLSRTYKGLAARVYIPAEATNESVRDSLISAFGEDFGGNAALLWRILGGTPEGSHGSYVALEGQNIFDFVRQVKEGRETPVKVTFNNVRTLDQLAKRVASKFEFTPEEFLTACNTVLPAKGYDTTETFSAAFLPDTYEFYWTTPASEVVAHLADHTNNFWTPERVAKAESLGLTPTEVATIASIVEEETAKPDEYGTVGRLYINRVQQGMKLQADPTVKFSVGDFSLRRILNKHLKTDSPYNTYQNAGLPPGPIRIAAPATIDAVLNSQPHNYLYMCASEKFNGRHNFAADYKTHMANARRYQAALNRRGIK